jgi:predicted amidohydrolase YtcJ
VIKAGAIHSMTGQTYRPLGVRVPEIVAVSPDLDGLDDLAGGGTAVVDAGDLTLLPAFADSHEHLMEASRNTLLVPVDRARSVAEFTATVAAAARDAAPGEWILTSISWHESNLAENRVPTLAELDTAALRARPMLRPTTTELMTILRQALGADRLDEVFSAGSRLTRQQAVAAVKDRRGASMSGQLGDDRSERISGVRADDDI